MVELSSAAPCRSAAATSRQASSEHAPRATGEHSVVSLFSGCGGMDLGFSGGFSFGGRHYARLPFRLTWANEIDQRACRTYALNIGAAHLHCGDIATACATLPRSADVVIGGFPCQDVSVNGLRRLDRGGRTVLYRHLVPAIGRCQPKVFVAENVKGLLMTRSRPFFDQMLADFRLPGYTVSYKVYLAAHYGVPQRRERVFLVGVKGSRAFGHPEGGERVMTAQEAIGDLEREPEARDKSHVWSRARRSPEQGSRRLKADRPATTIRAEHHGNIQWHYSLNRRISLREAARLQSFPDSFVFPCAMRATERQIGNAVPPVLAWRIAERVRANLEYRAV